MSEVPRNRGIPETRYIYRESEMRTLMIRSENPLRCSLRHCRSTGSGPEQSRRESPPRRIRPSADWALSVRHGGSVVRRIGRWTLDGSVIRRYLFAHDGGTNHAGLSRRSFSGGGSLARRRMSSVFFVTSARPRAASQLFRYTPPPAAFFWAREFQALFLRKRG